MTHDLALSLELVDELVGASLDRWPPSVACGVDDGVNGALLTRDESVMLLEAPEDLALVHQAAIPTGVPGSVSKARW